MSKNAKVSLTIGTVAVLVIGLLLLVNRQDSPEQTASAPSAPAAELVRPDSRRLSTAPDGKVTVVEFLDLECEACGAAFPGVERLRAEYGGRVTFVMRYFPIPSHRNAELAARAVEAAARQEKLEPMYKVMYQNQPQWAEQSMPQREVFLGYARQLGLDVAQFDLALDDPAVADRVARDKADGVSLGVRGTPTFFVNGTKFAGAPTYQALKAAIDAELAK